MSITRILVLGATGYVGTRLVGELLDSGYKVRAGSRSISKLKIRTWAEDPNVELVAVDVLNRDQLKTALQGTDVVYYLVHSMNPETEYYAETDRKAALNMRELAEECNIKLIVYLGGLGDEQPSLSKHLKSRNQVGKILQNGNVPVSVFRAAIIIGSSSTSFEILRYLVDRLPIMTTPRWVHTKNQPIFIRNVLNYLVQCLDVPETHGKTFDIGGPDVLSYADLMQTYAKIAGLKKRLIIPIPVLTPKLSSYWVNLITPINKEVARPLVEGLRNEVIVKDHAIKDLIPQKLVPIHEAIRRSLGSYRYSAFPESYNNSSFSPEVEIRVPGDPEWGGGYVVGDNREMIVRGDRDQIWQAIEQIGGTTGWYHADFLWRVRGIVDELIGGPGMRRGRQDAKYLKPGDYVDCWRVLKNTGKVIQLRAEMKLPGYALLSFSVSALPNSDYVKINQKASFIPRGLAGIVYWRFLLPLHNYVFNGMIKGISQQTNSEIIKGPYLVPHTRPSF